MVKEAARYRLDYDRPQSAGKVREFFGNVPQVIKAYAWLCAMGGDGIDEASDMSVLANNYMDRKLAQNPRPVALQSRMTGAGDGDDALGPRPAQGPIPASAPSRSPIAWPTTASIPGG